MIFGKAPNASSISFRLLVLPTLTHKIAGPSVLAARHGFNPNLFVGSRQQSDVDKVNRLTAGLTQCFRQRRRKLRVDQKNQNLFRRDDGMVRLTGSKGQNRIDVRVFKIRIILKNRLSRLSSRHQAKNVCHRNAQAANTWTAMHAIGIDRYSFQKV
jgi:hypothetical protein